VALVLHILKFPEVLERVLDRLEPHAICDFLYETAEKFNDFYRDCKVQGDPDMMGRLVICQVVAKVMHKALWILGITPLEKI
jgi:arginyl-tRNA synthetase